jgi:hypothetical protein
MRTRPLTAPPECKVFTPTRLAEAMAGVLPDAPGLRWLEPCVGQGVFLDALVTAGVERERITAVELDKHDLEAKCGSYFPGTDFLAWSLDTEKRFDRVIGNPPFLKLHRAHRTVVEAALKVPRPGGESVPLGSNCWYAFVCAALRLLRPAGGMCLVLPSGWDYADYATDLRKRLPQMFSRFEVVRSDRSFFDGILDGCVVLIADGFGRPCEQQLRFEFSELEGVIKHLHSPARPGEANRGERRLGEEGGVRFGDIARVRIGAVTGDANYFLLDEDRRTELGLGLQDVCPVLTRARHLSRHEVRVRDWERLRDSAERVWLFRPGHRPGRRPKAVVDYLRAGERQKCHTRQKTRNRETWFRTPLNPAADAFMSGMTSVGPWLCLHRSRTLTATNTLYTVHFAGRPTLGEKAAWSLALLSTTVAGQYEDVGRCYSKGLLKFEPRDVMALKVPRPVDTTAQAVAVYQLAVENLLADRVDRAREIAEAFVRRGRPPTASSERALS